ncbi:MAG TPA: hypothetical protein VGE22_11030 [Solimonas sp.]
MSDEKRFCEDCTRPIWGVDGVANPAGKGLLHKACAERMSAARDEDREPVQLEPATPAGELW